MLNGVRIFVVHHFLRPIAAKRIEPDQGVLLLPAMMKFSCHISAHPFVHDWIQLLGRIFVASCKNQKGRTRFQAGTGKAAGIDPAQLVELMGNLASLAYAAVRDDTQLRPPDSRPRLFPPPPS